MATAPEKLLIGAHTSAAGGVQNALLEGVEIGATTVQLFTANQRRWTSKPLEKEAVELFRSTLKETGLQKIMSHDSYLINLGAPDPENLKKSRLAFEQEIDRCQALGVTFLNFHPGAALKDDPQLCLDRICESLLLFEDQLKGGDLRLLLESTAGQGSNVGYDFHHLGYIIKKVETKLPIGVCIDTCHSFAAGYDLRTKEAVDATLKEFDEIVGLKHLYAFHFNDSLKGLGSRVDRHRPLGEGEIGIECFKTLMTDKRTRDIPKYLETPGGPELWVKEIRKLRELAKG
ncbi:MAG: deoxyribonuclease IV [Chlamydiales bacterium]|nr:deoxyribonuclease IV [Chlamydiia bacterium]MCP5506973.1 deoxyribonuclease IV [Chlamydiales bacterium]